jgi:hypothetical protein
MTEEQFINLSDSDFLEIWEIFRKESYQKTDKNTPVGFGDFLREKYGLDINSINDKNLKKLANYTINDGSNKIL